MDVHKNYFMEEKLSRRTSLMKGVLDPKYLQWQYFIEKECSWISWQVASDTQLRIQNQT